MVLAAYVRIRTVVLATGVSRGISPIVFTRKGEKGSNHEEDWLSSDPIVIVIQFHCRPKGNYKKTAGKRGGTAVPGTELRRNVATVKPGYEFVNRGSAVDVVNKNKSFKTGTYVCPCGGNDPNRKCDIVFSPTQITCKSGSCSGSCLLTAAPRVMSQ